MHPSQCLEKGFSVGRLGFGLNRMGQRMTTLYLTEPGSVVRYHNETLQVKRGEKLTTVRLGELEMVLIFPGVQLTDVVIRVFFKQGIETIFLGKDGYFQGRLQGQFATNPLLRLAQYRLLETTFGMALAQRLVWGKVRNQRLLLQRRYRDTGKKINGLAEAIDLMGAYCLQLKSVETPKSREELMGVEGICARHYYQALRHWFPEQWQFTGRNRRPPRDPINALLSWGYGVLLGRIFTVTVQVGLDPYLGFFHALQPYRPNLVLDLMEEFRPVLVDKAVINLVRSGVLDPLDFEVSPDGEGVWLGLTAKRLLIRELEKLLQSPLLYSPQGRRLKLSQIMVEQGRYLGRCLMDLSVEYQPFILD